MSEIDVLCGFFWKAIRKFHGVSKTHLTADAAFLDEACSFYRIQGISRKSGLDDRGL